MAKIGITGGIGAGKTVVAHLFETLGYPVYFADYEAKRLMSESPKIKEGLLALLGEKAFTYNTLNRPFIAQAIFGNPALMQQVNALVHPVVDADFERWATSFPTSSLLFLESALIYESNLQNKLDAVICVTAPLALRLQRVMRRDAASKEEVLKRMAVQKAEEEKAAQAHFIIRNDDETALIPQLQAMLPALAIHSIKRH